MQADDNNAEPAHLRGSADVAEYALGTLGADASAAMAGQAAEQPELAAQLVRWRSRLAALAGLAGEQAPPASVWARVEAGMAMSGSARQPVAVDQGAAGGLWQSLSFWRGLGMAGVASAAVLAGLLAAAPQPAVMTTPAPMISQVDLLSVLSTEQGAGIWLVKLDEPTGTMRVKVLNPQPAGVDQDFELWLVPGDGGAPRSLGILPGGSDHRLAVATELRQAMPAAAALAVSIEPSGGSPTGAPTGPVRYTGQVIQL